MRRLIWRAQALADLDRIHAWLSTVEIAEPDRAMHHIRAAANGLIRFGDIGRPSRIEGVRELSVRVAPYVIAYRVNSDAIDILPVYHNAQNQ
ncbi:MAG: type II toxin-antitoxin system RelE/ParE family toxin [Alphaproteobacteria bacterium]|nr:type II toxin-antitoxin system RelE/ParE family toxin [Alphaproteobacteria bacterium]